MKQIDEMENQMLQAILPNLDDDKINKIAKASI